MISTRKSNRRKDPGFSPKGSFRHERLRRVQGELAEKKIDVLLLSHLPNIRYLTGFSGSNALLIVHENRAEFLSDGRYDEQARFEVGNASVHIATKRSLSDEIRFRNLFRKGRRIGIEGEHISVAQHDLLRKTFPKRKFVPLAGLVESHREVKSVEEMDFIRAAAEISDRVFRDLLGMIKPGVAEQELAAEISYRHRKYGASGDAFDPIVLTGPRTSLIHGTPSGARIRNREAVLMDFGCVVEGYCSDMTRTVFVGSPGREMKKIHATVLSAQRRAVATVREGTAARDVDAAARRTIVAAGYGKYFTHSTGHGVGLEIHEQPRLSRLSGQTLKRNHVVTVEPGIYVPGLGGVRIEDDLLVLADSSIPLNGSPKEMILL